MRNRNGIALIIVLAVVAILSVVVLEFSYSIRVDMYVSANYEAETQALYAAKAGVEYAIYVLRTDEDVDKDWLGDSWAQPIELNVGELVPPPPPEDDDEADDEYTYYEEPERERDSSVVEARHGGTVKVTITDEERKIGLNSLVDSQGRPRQQMVDTLERLIENLHVEGATYNPSDIVEQMIDWIDADDEGVWEYSYESLPEPYEPPNRPFATVDELRLLADMSDTLLYGTVPFPEDEESRDEYENSLGYDWSYGLINFVHVQSLSWINLNTASREVLTALFDDSYAADEVIDRRREYGGFNAAEADAIVKEVGGEDSPVSSMVRVRSLFYRIVSVGEYRNVRVKITAVVYRSTRGDVTVQYYRIENVR